MFVNPASTDILGYSQDELCNSQYLFKKVIHPDCRVNFEKKWIDLLDGNIPSIFEYRIVTKSGKPKWLYQKDVLVFDENGMPIAIEGIATDIPTLRRQSADRFHSKTLYFRLVDCENQGSVGRSRIRKQGNI
jgi:PAS domain S-box-containing protein